MIRSVNLIVILDKTGRHSVNIAPTDCDDLTQAQAFLIDFGSEEKVVDFISLDEPEPEDPAFAIFEQLLKMEDTLGTIEGILTTVFLRGLRIPHDVAAGLA